MNIKIGLTKTLFFIIFYIMDYEEVREFFFANGYRAVWDPLELGYDIVDDKNCVIATLSPKPSKKECQQIVDEIKLELSDEYNAWD